MKRLLQLLAGRGEDQAKPPAHEVKVLSEMDIEEIDRAIEQARSGSIRQLTTEEQRGTGGGMTMAGVYA